MSFLKYLEDRQITEGNGRGKVYFHRTHLDGIPFRGQQVMLREEEYDDLTETVQDAKIDLFALDNAEQKAKLQEILDRSANGWYRILDMDHKWVEREDGSTTKVVYLVWTEPHKEFAKHRLPGNIPEINALPIGGNLP